MVASADGNIRLDNTFEGRMERSANCCNAPSPNGWRRAPARSSMGRVVEINGPLVTIELADVRTGEEVHVGSMNLSGEVIGRNGARALVQAWWLASNPSRVLIDARSLGGWLVDLMTFGAPRRRHRVRRGLPRR